MVRYDWQGAYVALEDDCRLAFVTDRLDLCCAQPCVTLLQPEGLLELRPGPGARQTVTQDRCFNGELTEHRWEWAQDGFACTWSVGVLRDRPRLLLQASVTNGTGHPVRLRGFTLLQSAVPLHCAGDPAQWWLSTLEHQTRLGSLSDVLPSSNDCERLMWKGFDLPIPYPLSQDERHTDGRWRIYPEYLTLFHRQGGDGLAIGPVGDAIAVVRHEYYVDGGGMGLQVRVEMTDILLQPGQTRQAQPVLVCWGEYHVSLETLLHWVAATHGSRTHRGPLWGWCSWYDLGPHISAQSVEETVDAFLARGDRRPPDVIQIDDGYQRQVGDWQCNERFPDGLEPLVRRIERTGAMPGIWLAPLAVHESTGLVQAHPEWFQKDAQGNLLGEANNWGPRSRWLDPTHPDAQSFLREILRTKKRQGFRYFKIDFNTLATDCRYYDAAKTRLQAYRELYALYRQEIGEDSYLLSCSAFTRGTVGFADASRIGPDSCAVWSAAHPCTLLESIRAVGMNAIANGIWYANDPDVTYLMPRPAERPSGQCDGDGSFCPGMNLDELRTWHGFVGLLGGMALVSDPIGRQPFAEHTDMLDMLAPPAAQRGLPLNPGAERDHTRFGFVTRQPWGSFACVQLWNAGESAAELPLGPLEGFPEQGLHAWSFWDETYLGILCRDDRVPVASAHGSRLLRLTPAKTAVTVVGSTLHIGMGSAELADIRTTDHTLTILLNDAGRRQGSLYVHGPQRLVLRRTQGCRVPAVAALGNGLWRVDVADRCIGQTQQIVLDWTGLTGQMDRTMEDV